ncbi:hypothetical protein AX17_002987 [Amanita inopinata Kibby_2008]|nr:hypothetical protein AX17_002987 [Amanita inopinata Kibby_2008]
MMSGESDLALRDQTYTSLVALTVQVWEFLVCFGDEVEYLWPTRFTVTKVLYFWSRYLSLIAQIVNAVLTRLLYSQYSTARNCYNMLVFWLFLAQQAVACLELVALLRVYVLYNKSTRVGVSLLLVFAIESVVKYVGVSTRVRSLGLETTCTPSKTGTKGGIYILLGVGMNQCVVMSLIIAKLVIGRSVGWGRTPLASLMMRDGVATFMLLGAVLGGVVAINSVQTRDKLRDAKLSPMFIALLSTIGSRLILNMCCLVQSSRETHFDDSSVPVLTTQVDL